MSQKRRVRKSKWLRRTTYSRIRSEKRRANWKRAQLYSRSRAHSNIGTTYDPARSRAEMFRHLYRRRDYSGVRQNVPVIGQFGIEQDGLFEGYLELASSFTDHRSRHLNFDFNQCDRLWPSSIMLLCSLKQWVEMTHSLHRRPRLSSTAAQNPEVNSYLAHCGFYQFVSAGQVPLGTGKGTFDEDKIVKIRRETQNEMLDQREDEIMALLKRHSNLDDEQLESFMDKALLEVMGNVLEHGIAHRDNGWWLLAQYHPTHKFISLCIADNGMGVQNSLVSGPQKEEIVSRLADIPNNSGEFIKMALTEMVSGAQDATVKQREMLVTKRFPGGRHRGHGLKRVAKVCKELSIPFSVLSHHGAVSVDAGGEIAICRSMPSRVFAGTMFNFVIRGDRR